MREEPGTPGSLRDSSCRVAVLVVVIGCHLGLLMLLLLPGTFFQGATTVVRDNPLVLRLRFFHPSQPPSPHPALPTRRVIAPPVYGHATVSARSPKRPADQRAENVDAQPSETLLIRVPQPVTSEEDSTGDGGFQGRLHRAQHAYSIHGVPGSDTPSAPGIHFVDPMSQGLDAVMRTAQRGFGITNSHCVDVAVWRHLTPKELSARHISQSDVDKVDEKYDCNKPPGLRF